MKDRLTIRAKVEPRSTRDVIRWGVVIVVGLEVVLALKIWFSLGIDTRGNQVAALVMIPLLPLAVPLFAWMNGRDAAHLLLRMSARGVSLFSVNRRRRSRMQLRWSDVTQVMHPVGWVSLVGKTSSIVLHRANFSDEQWARIEHELRERGLVESHTPVAPRIDRPLFLRRSEKKWKEQRNGVIVFLGFLGAIGLAFVIVVMLVPAPPNGQKWQALTLASIWFALIGLVAGLIVLQQLPHRVRIDHYGLTLTSRPRRTIKRVRWQDVTRVLMQWGRIELATPNQNVRLGGYQFEQAEWQHLRESIRMHLADRFDFVTPSPGEVANERVRTMPFSRRLVRLTLLIVVGVVLTLACIAVLLYIGDTPRMRNVAPLIATSPIFIMLIVPILFARRWSFWRSPRGTGCPPARA